MDLLRWAIFIIVALWIIWFLTGGPQSGFVSKPFLRPPAPIDTGELYGEPTLIPGFEQRSENKDGGEVAENGKKEPVSIFNGSVKLQSGNTYATGVNEEYVEVFASYNNKQPVNITGWTIKSAITGKSAIIPKGVYMPFSGVVNKEENIFLNPGDRAIITTGDSPKGVSFRLNTCTGYFEQFQDFTPMLPQQCPRPSDEKLPLGPNSLEDVCVKYIEQIPACVAHIQALPIGLSDGCNEYINKNIHYNGCLGLHKNDSDFYKPEWRIFLKRSEKLWKSERETIKLLDADGKTIDSLSY